MPLSFAVANRLCTAAARIPARSLPANSQFFLPIAIGRIAFSTGLLVYGQIPGLRIANQARPSIQRVVDRTRPPATVSGGCAQMNQPIAHIRQDRQTVLSAMQRTGIRIHFARCFLDGIQLADTPQGFRRLWLRPAR